MHGGCLPKGWCKNSVSKPCRHTTAAAPWGKLPLLKGNLSNTHFLLSEPGKSLCIPLCSCAVTFVIWVVVVLLVVSEVMV